MFANYRIGTRLAFGFGGVILASVLAFGLAVLQGRHGQAALAETSSATLSRVGMVHGMIEAQLQLVSSIRNAGLQTAGEKINGDVDAYKQAMATLARLESEFARLEVSDQERQLVERASQLRTQSEPIVQEAIGYTMAFDGEEAAKTLTTRLAPIQAEWAAALQQLGTLQAERAASQAAEIAASNDRRAIALASVLALVAVGTAAFALLLTRSVTRPLEQAAHAAERVAQGDLSVRLQADGRDEAAQLLRALQAMAEQLAGMVRAVRESSEAIRGAAAEISSGNADLSNRTEQSAASLQEASATLDSLTESVAENNGHARDASQVVTQTGAIAEQGGRAMVEVVEKMQGISESSRRIADIIGVIDGIAFQTNILALNAAVEAARAGEQGRGFAVVAGEVRSLAQRSAEAAKEIKSLITTSVERVEQGSALVEQMRGTMGDLVGGVGRMQGLVTEIAAASGSQHERIREVNESVRGIDGSTQQNAALVEQVAAAAQSLSSQTERLAGLVNRFRVEAAGA